MKRNRLRKALPVLAILAGLFLGPWLARAVVPTWLEGERGENAAPVLVLSQSECDLGTAKQGAVLQATFPVTNAGTRRLILTEHLQGCCDEKAEPRQVSLEPGESKDLEIQLDTTPWYGHVEHAIHYTTNDPRMPRLTLSVTAKVES
ncbi:MAG: Ig-like domain-containing protein [Planctomycetota bacterium]|jgi:hypothetical protein